MRIRSLDSLRGIAALVVVIHHAVLVFPGLAENREQLHAELFRAPDAWLYLTPLRLAVGGPAAVLVFFVLSGLVLALTSINQQEEPWTAFMVKRVTRIWVPFALAILVAFGLSDCLTAGGVSGTSTWFTGTLPYPATLEMLAIHLGMSGGMIWLDNPMWSLIHEMRISAIFPLLLLLSIRNWRAALAGGVVVSFFSAWLLTRMPDGGVTVSLVTTLAYPMLFIMGIAIATHREQVQGILARLPRAALAGLWALSLVFLCAWPDGVMHVAGLHSWTELLVSSAGAALLVMLCINEGRTRRILTMPAFLWLGRVSYSLYLLHMIVLSAIIRACAGWAPLPVLVIGGIVLSLALSDLSARYVEQPVTLFGRHLAFLLQRRDSVSAST